MADDQSLPAVIDQTAQFLEQPTDRGLWDTAAFQQTERVATIMVDSQLMPKALTHYKEGQGNNAVEKPLPEKVQFARAVLICNQAFTWMSTRCSSPSAARLCTTASCTRASWSTP
jgi:hypothetical protein